MNTTKKVLSGTSTVIARQYLTFLLPVVLFNNGCNLSTKTGTIAPEVDLLEYVDPFIGTGFHGHTFPGPVLPFGMVQLSPDTRLNGWDASSGYHYEDSTIYGFTHTHLSGTGIGDMGDILFLPFTGEPDQKPLAIFNKAEEHARAGYYSVKFEKALV